MRHRLAPQLSDTTLSPSLDLERLLSHLQNVRPPKLGIDNTLLRGPQVPSQGIQQQRSESSCHRFPALLPHPKLDVFSIEGNNLEVRLSIEARRQNSSRLSGTKEPPAPTAEQANSVGLESHDPAEGGEPCGEPPMRREICKSVHSDADRAFEACGSLTW